MTSMMDHISKQPATISLVVADTCTGIRVVRLYGLGDKKAIHYQIKHEGTAFGDFTTDEIDYLLRPTSPFELKGSQKVREVYSRLTLTETEYTALIEKRAAPETVAKLKDALNRAQTLQRQWHPYPHTEEQAKEIHKENTKALNAQAKRMRIE